MNFIQWCNDDNGFLTAILSLIGLILSATAIVVSIRTARLPYKKRIMLDSSPLPDVSVVTGVSVKFILSISGMSASATNIGNRTVNLMYLGYATKKHGRYIGLPIFPHNREFNCKVSLAPSEMSESQFYTDELIKSLSREDCNKKLFVYAIDTEKKEYVKEAGTTVGELLNSLSKSELLDLSSKSKLLDFSSKYST